MTPNETLLTAVLKDAIAMMRWQAREPLTVAAWAFWIERAIEALDTVQRNNGDTLVRAKPFKIEELRAAAVAAGITEEIKV
jgi:hypothetical protein